MAELNLMDQYPKPRRPIVSRGRWKLSGKGRISLDRLDHNTEDILFEHRLANAAKRFGKEYFDGDRLWGYGGYYYNPRFWTRTVRRLRDHYQLEDGASILDVGCAKGFMLHDFKVLMPTLCISGIDISQYAIDHALDDVKPFIQVGDASALPYEDKSFDLVISINTAHNLPLEGCKAALREIQRVSRRQAFITVGAWRNEQERERLLTWNLTGLTYMHVEDWMRLFDEVGYTRDYYWFFAE